MWGFLYIWPPKNCACPCTCLSLFRVWGNFVLHFFFASTCKEACRARTGARVCAAGSFARSTKPASGNMYEFCRLPAGWTWDHGLPENSAWERVPATQQERINGHRDNIVMRGSSTRGYQPWRLIVHDVVDQRRIFVNVHGERLMVRPVGPALLLSVHAEVLQQEQRVRCHG